MAKYFKTQQPNILTQIGAMKSKYPQFHSTVKGVCVTFTGELMVKPELPIYTVSVEYRGDQKPLVHIISPSLVENAKHTYSDKSLCLYHPDNFNWHSSRLVAKEIMQWTIAWIYFYEYWLQSGEWIGPEVSHSKEKTNE